MSQRPQTTNGGIVDNFCIAPNTTNECINVNILLSHLNLDPFVIAIANAAGGSLIRVHTFAERKVTQTSVAVNIMRPFALALPDIQAIC